MRLVLASATILAVLIATSRAQAADEPKALIEKAIAASGGEALVKQAKSAVSWKTKGKVYPMGQEIAFTGKGCRMLPDKMRQDLEINANGNEMKIVFGSGSKGSWMVLNDAAMDAPESQQTSAQIELHATNVCGLVALRGDGFKLESLGASEVDGKKVEGIKVSMKDKPDIKLFIDPSSNLVVKCEFKTVDGQSGSEVNQEMFFADYKDFSGVKRATKIMIKRDGEKFLDSESTDYKVEDKVDEKQFDKPAGG